MTSTVVALVLLLASPAATSAGEEVCHQVGASTSLPGLPEASGITASTSGPLQLFAVNDSGTPTVAILSEAGRLVRTVPITGADVFDWEDVTVGRCGAGACLYIGDIGDNNRVRDALRIYRVPLPLPAAPATVRAEVFELTYPDRAHDAEAMFAMPNGDLYLVTKETGRASIYKLPAFMPGARGTLTRVATLRFRKDASRRVTDADASPDGRWIALRSNTTLDFYHLGALLAGRATAAVRVDLRELHEPQGEGVTFGANGTLYLVGEGGGKKRPGTFARLRCTLP